MHNVGKTPGNTLSKDWGNNRLRARLDAGEYVVGLTITSSNLETAVLGAKLGFHFLWVEMEHAPVSLEALRSIVLAARGLDASVLARVPVVALWTAKRVLDQGVRGVIFPFVSDPEIARTAALSCHYPPAGLRGSGAGLAASTWFEPGNYYDSADAQMLTVCVIEEQRALAHVDAIAATPGVDVLFIGTSDLSFSLDCVDARMSLCCETRLRPSGPPRNGTTNSLAGQRAARKKFCVITATAFSSSSP